jgi:ABC-2 type transport system permease protein
LIFAIVRTAVAALRRDRASLALSFLLPIAFFSIFAIIFGSQHDTVPRIRVILVDEDQSPASLDLVKGLRQEGSLVIATRPTSKSKGMELPNYTAGTAEAAVKAGDVSVALVIPQGWGKNPIAFGPGGNGPAVQLLNDASDTIAPQMVSGLLQKTAMTSMPLVMAEKGSAYTGEFIGGFTPEQHKKIDANMARLKQLEDARATNGPAAGSNETGSGLMGPGTGGIIAVETRSVVGESKNKPMISFYAAAIGVMFLLFTASGSAGSLLDEAESGTLDRVLSSQVTMTTLLAGKAMFNTLLAFVQLAVMFLYGWAVFHLDLLSHILGFVVMGLCTAFAVAAFGILLASMCHTRGQLGAVSTLLILIMSSVGGSMFPRFLMPPAMQKAGLFTINAWAIDGFTKVFWRDLPVTALWPQVSVLLAVGLALFLIARRIARRWEFA